MSRTRWQEPNLARAPFVNERPVRRLAVTLWLLFAVVGGLAAWQSLASREATGSSLATLLRLTGETAAARERATTLERELRAADLVAQNERTQFLNRRLDERAFSWGNLLETLAAALPRGVRVVRLSPESFVQERRGKGAPVTTPATTRVELRLTGEAEDTEAMLEFVDRLFQHPAFEGPSLARESEKKDTRIQFELAVAYLPEVAAGGTNHSSAMATTASTPGAPLVSGSAPGAPAAAPGNLGPAAAGALAATGPPARSGAPQGSPADRGVAGRAQPTPRATAGVSAWGEGGSAEAEGRSVKESGGRAAGAAPAVDVSAGAVPTLGATSGGGLRPGSTPSGAPSGAPPASGGAPFPANVMPTPLRPYASSTGGGR